MPDAELIARVKAGEVEAFGELYRRYLDQVYRYIRTRVSSDQDTEDLTEAVFLKAFEALETYKERGAPFGAFLYRIAANLVIDHYRKQKPDKPLEDAEGLPKGGATTESQVIQKESLHEVQTALSKLAFHHQEVGRFGFYRAHLHQFGL